jgi:DNA primase
MLTPEDRSKGRASLTGWSSRPSTLGLDMPEIPEDTIREIKERIDIVDLVGGHVGLRQSGRQFKGLCPFHSERTPSFYVDPNRRSYKCFGCGEWGDAIDFIQKVEGRGFVEAVRSLAPRAGVALPNEAPEAQKRSLEREHEREAAEKITKLAADLYRKILVDDPLGAAGRAYQV